MGYTHPLKKEVCEQLKLAIAQVCQEKGVEAPQLDLYSLLARPPQFSLGQVAFPCFPLAKVLRGAPQQIAEACAKLILNHADKKLIGDVKAVGGYLNFFVHANAFAESVLPYVRGEKFGCDNLLESSQREKIMVEYSQPNTHKSMHIGHLRCLVLGDAVSNVLKFVGHDVVKATYPGDFGANVVKTLWYLKYRNKEKIPQNERAAWIGKIYAAADDALKKEKGTPQEEKNRKDLQALQSELQSRNGEVWDIYSETRVWCLQEMSWLYAQWMNVQFDVWFFESECEQAAKELVLKKCAEGVLKKDQGAIGISLEEEGLGFALYLKTDGSTLYLTKDLELLRRKFEEFKIDRSMYVVDSRQKLHFQQLFKSAEKMGYKQAAKSVHLPYETVNDEEGKALSSRTLNGMSMHEVKKLIEDKVTGQYLERYRGQWTDEEINHTARDVTIGALKYGMIRVDNNTAIQFVLDEWLRLDGETGPYLQYVHARCCSLLQKQESCDAPHQYLLTEEAEKELLFEISTFLDVTLQAGKGYRPHVVAAYLYDLAKLFNRFYEFCPIQGAGAEVKQSRIALVAAVKNVMKTGLGILGIPAPQRM